MSVLTAVENEDSAKAVVSTGHELATALGVEQVIVHIASSATNSDRRRATIEKLVREAIGGDELPRIEIRTEPSIWERDGPSKRIADEITTEAANTDAKYIVIGSRKHSPAGKAILGNVAQFVLIDSSIPVVIEETD